MAPKQLRCRDLKGGDIMLQHSLGNMGGRAIAFGEWLTGHKFHEIIHAGVMFDSTFIIEALGNGIQANDLRTGNKACGYQVYRPRNPTLGTVEANFVKMLFDQHGQFKNLDYTYLGAVASIGASRPAKSELDLDKMVDDIFNARSSPFFCSQFVVMTYQISAGQIGIPYKSVFALDDARVSPARLATMLSTNPHFQHVGYVLPNER